MADASSAQSAFKGSHRQARPWYVASVFPDFEPIPPALMFWRCMTQWLGGMGIVVLSVAQLPMLGVGG